MQQAEKLYLDFPGQQTKKRFVMLRKTSPATLILTTWYCSYVCLILILENTQEEGVGSLVKRVTNVSAKKGLRGEVGRTLWTGERERGSKRGERTLLWLEMWSHARQIQKVSQLLVSLKVTSCFTIKDLHVIAQV
ncbi:Hypothetical predicted protein [Xyrichtys novacula]|uniref:Uncharacterized protein n=1 Tax=Xyrichtys novacula TaxID=13765 RepID=A0AAV1EIH3_XYRNO|nr:Hypothetical predicted protein [Xyrichtys novacula]